MTQEDVGSTNLGFVREDIGLAILGAVAAVIGLVVANGADDGSQAAEVFGILGMAGLVLAFWRVIHLGYRLAFPKKR